MRLVEVLVASTVLAVASTSSLQMAATSATVQQGTLRRERQAAEMERDRQRLQGLWRQARLDGSGCAAMTAELLRLAAALPAPPQVQRHLQATHDGTEVLARWSDPGHPGLERERRFSPAALGLCVAVPDPVSEITEVSQTDQLSQASQPLATPVEGVQP